MHSWALTTMTDQIGGIGKLARCGRSAIRRRVAFVVFGTCILASSCNEGRTTWSAQARSPGGHWVATARSQQWGGPGTARDATTVYLQWINGPLPPERVLGFSHEYATMNLKMRWQTPTHLDVTYGPSTRAGDHVSVSFQAIKYGDVEISLQPALSEAIDATR